MEVKLVDRHLMENGWALKLKKTLQGSMFDGGFRANDKCSNQLNV